MAHSLCTHKTVQGQGPRPRSARCGCKPTCRWQRDMVGQTLEWPVPSGAPDTEWVLGEDQLDYYHCHHYSASKRQHTTLPLLLMFGFPRFSLLIQFVIFNLGLKILSGKFPKKLMFVLSSVMNSHVARFRSVGDINHSFVWCNPHCVYYLYR